MANTPRLALPEMSEAQALKYLTHNTGLRYLDCLVQAVVIDKDAATPPVGPVDGDAYIVASGGTDAWMNQDGNIASFQVSDWVFLQPASGWQVYVVDEGVTYVCDGASEPGWSPFVDRAYEVSTFFSGHPTSGQSILVRPVPADVAFPIDLAGSLGRCQTAPDNAATFSIQVNDVEVASMTFDDGSNDATFADAGSLAVSITSGDRLSIVGPTPADAAIADIGVCLLGRRL